MLESVEVGERVFDLRQLYGVVGREESRARELEVVLGLLVAVAPPVETADVVLDAASGEQVAVFEEACARAQASLDGLLVAAEHGERDELADLRGAGRVRLTEELEARLRVVEPADGILHSAADKRGDARAPVAQRRNLLRVVVGGEGFERGGGGDGARRVAAPRFEADVLERVGQRDVGRRRVRGEERGALPVVNGRDQPRDQFRSVHLLQLTKIPAGDKHNSRGRRSDAHVSSLCPWLLSCALSGHA